MKPRRLLSMHLNPAALLVRAIGLQIAVSAAASAAQFTWDTNSTSSGAQDGGGTWDTGSKFWNGTSTVAWPNTSSNNPDEAIFGNGGTAGPVTVSGIKYVNSLTFNAVGSGSYALSGTSDIRFQGSSPGITSNTTASITAPLRTDTSGTTTFTSNSGTLTLGFSRLTRSNGGARTFALGGAGDGAWTTGIINPHSDAPVSLTKSGTGTWTLSGFNGYTGATTISEGVLSTDRIGNPESAVSLVATSLGLNTTANSNTVTLSAGSTSSLTVGQTVYNINIPGGRTIASITNSTTFVLSDGAGVLAGTSQPAVFGESSGLGLATADAANLVFNGTAGNGSLKYTGTTQDTGRAFTINAGKVATIEVTNSGTNLTFVGATGAPTTGALTKTGAGTLTLSGANTYTGATIVSAGTLYVNGSLHADSDVSVAGNAVIGGTGLINGDLTLAGGAILNIVDINDPLAVGGTVSFSGFGFGNIAGWNYQDAATGTYTLLAGNVSLANVSNVGLENALTLNNGNKAYFQTGSLQVVIVPEPRAALLGGLGILILLRRRR